MSLEASTTRPPLGSTWVTRAVRVVVRVVVRLVVPWPLSCVSPETLARLASGPVALVTPASAVIEFLVLEVRCVLVVPVVTAEACSATTMVSMSSTWLARTSRAASARRDPASQMEPGVAAGASAERARRPLPRSGRAGVGRRRGGFLLVAAQRQRPPKPDRA